MEESCVWKMVGCVMVWEYFSGRFAGCRLQVADGSMDRMTGGGRREMGAARERLERDERGRGERRERWGDGASANAVE
jgi:hypothetical protein